MKTTVKEITPQWAKQVLETKNPNNRTVSDRVVDKYANDMRHGNWALTHQGIAFDINGDLLDGQHRLAAVVKSGRSILMPVTVGIERSIRVNGHAASIFSMIDGIRPRTPASMLAINGHKHSTAVAAIARAMAQMTSVGAWVNLSAPVTEEIVRLTKGAIDEIAALTAGKKSICRLPSTVLAPIAFWATVDIEAATQFAVETREVSSGKGSPSRALATWLSHHNTSGFSVGMQAIEVSASAVRCKLQNKTLEKIYGSRDAVQFVLNLNAPLTTNIRALLK